MQSEAPMKLDRLKHSSASQASSNHTSDRPAFPVARPVVRTGDDILRNRIQTMARFCSGKLLDKASGRFEQTVEAESFRLWVNEVRRQDAAATLGS